MITHEWFGTTLTTLSICLKGSSSNNSLCLSGYCYSYGPKTSGPANLKATLLPWGEYRSLVRYSSNGTHLGNSSQNIIIMFSSLLRGLLLFIPTLLWLWVWGVVLLLLLWRLLWLLKKPSVIVSHTYWIVITITSSISRVSLFGWSSPHHINIKSEKDEW